MGSAEVVSKLDVLNGCYQIPLTEQVTRKPLSLLLASSLLHDKL